MFWALSLEECVLLFDVNVRIPCVEKQTLANTILLGWCSRWHILFLWSLASIFCSTVIGLRVSDWSHQRPWRCDHFSTPIPLLLVSMFHPRGLRPTCIFRSPWKCSSNLSTLRNDLTLFGMMSQDISEYFPSPFSFCCCCFLSLSCCWSFLLPVRGSWLNLKLSYFGCVFGVCPCLWMLIEKSPRVFAQIPCPPPEVVTCWRPLIVMSSSRLPVSLWKLLRVSRINCLTSADPSFRLSRICGIWGFRWSWLWSRVHLVPIPVSILLWCEFFSVGLCKFCWSSILRIPAVSVRIFPLGPCLAWTECSCRRWCIGACWPSGDIHFCCCSFDLVERMCDRSRWPIYVSKIFLHHEFLDHIQSKLSHFLFRRHFNETCGNGSS